MGREVNFIEADSSAEFRRQFLESNFLPHVEDMFRRDDGVKSVILVVAQYYCDEAEDAVHIELVPCVDATPQWPECVLDNPFFTSEEGELELSERGWKLTSAFSLPGEYFRYPQLDSNTTAITAFASYCEDFGSQEDGMDTNGTPYAVAVRQPDGTAAVDVIGRMHRPEWEDRFDIGFSDVPTVDAASLMSHRKRGFWSRFFRRGQ